MCTDDETNAEIAARTIELGPRPGGGTARLVHVENDDLRDALNDRAVRRASPDLPVIEFFSVRERAARGMLRRFPVVADGGPPASAHMVVVGLGSLGSALTVAAVRQWATLGATHPLAVTVLDEGSEEKVAGLVRSHPALARHTTIETIELDRCGSQLLVVDLPVTKPGSALAPVYVCLEPEMEALAVALQIRDRLAGTAIPVVVAVASEAESAGRFLDDGQAAGGLHVLGMIEDTCTPELLFDTVVETIARAIHETYLRSHVGTVEAAGRTAANVKPWNDLDERVKEDNRAQARHLGAKLEALGADVGPLLDWDRPQLDLADAEVESLARMEHDRWLAARRRERRQATAEARDGFESDPDMVEWQDLPEPRREIDRAFVRALPSILARAGLSITRRADRDVTTLRDLPSDL